MNKYAVELIGTFFLVLTIGLSVNMDGGPLAAPLAIGAVLMAVIYAGGHVSFAHYNPAVTLAFFLRRRMAASDVAPYIAAQLLGTGLAVPLAAYLLIDAPTSTPPSAVGPLLVAEIVFTFALCWVILNVATAAANGGNSFYGLAIAATVVGAILVVGPVSGAVLNPAVALGLCVMERLPWHLLWVYVIAQVIGAGLATAAFRVWVKD